MTRTRRGSGLTSNAAHPFTFVGPEIELAVIGQRRKVGILKGDTGPVQIDLAANTPDPGPDRTVDINRIAPGLLVMVAHGAPSGIVMERTTDAGRFRRVGIAALSQPGEAVAAGHPLFDQRPAVALPGLAAGLHADHLVEGNPDPLLDHREGRRTFPGELDEFANLAADRLNLVIAGALPADHADGDIAATVDRSRKRRDRRPPFTAAGGEQIVTHVAGPDDEDREWQHIRRHEPVEMLVDGFRLPAGVGEDRAIGHSPCRDEKSTPSN